MEMIWKTVPEFGEYEVSEHGNVRHGLKYLKPERVKGNGRKRFTLSKEGRLYRMHASHLVALTFIGPKPFDGAEVCHNDSFFHNNHYSNLRWDTHAGNMVDVLDYKLKLARDAAGVTLKRDQLRLSASVLLASAR